MRRARLEEIPADHRRAPPRMACETEGGIPFDLEVRTVRRHVGSSGIVKAHVAAMRRGGVMHPADMQREETEIALFVRGRQRVDIRLNPNSTYSVGHVHARSLRDIVGKVMARFEPQETPGPRGP